MSNYTTLQKNTLDGLSETAGCLYLLLCDAFQGHRLGAGEVRAFNAACRYEKKCGEVLDYIWRNMPDPPTPEVRQSLSRFFAVRWKNNFLGKA